MVLIVLIASFFSFVQEELNAVATMTRLMMSLRRSNQMKILMNAKFLKKLLIAATSSQRKVMINQKTAIAFIDVH